MSWPVRDVVNLRLDVVQRFQQGESIAALSRRYAVSRPTIYRWLKRFLQQPGLDSLNDHSHAPHFSPYRTPEALQLQVVNLRRHFGWGARKLALLLTISASTVYRILKRHALVEPASRKRAAPLRFERSQPNELWQMDFKGPLAGNPACQPLSLIDDHSRYALGLWDVPNHHGRTVQRLLLDVFQRCGMPRELLVDHGTPWWSTTNSLGLTWLSVWLLRQEIRLRYSAIGHPQTQGKVERFHRSLEEEWARSGRIATASPRERQALLDRWRQDYNELRPHEALGMAPPSSRWQPSPRRYQDNPPQWWYRSAEPVVRLNPAGALSWHGERYYVSESLQGERVQIIAVEPSFLYIRYRHYLVREIDMQTHRSRALCLDEWHD